MVTTTLELLERVKRAWEAMEAPSPQDMAMMEWEWGTEAARAFTGVRPVDVAISSPGFDAATPLLKLPRSAAAAYLGTYLISLLKELDFQERVGLYDDIVTRAHTLTCLTLPRFWRNVIRVYLPDPCVAAVADVARLLAMKRELLALDQDQVDILLDMANSR